MPEENPRKKKHAFTIINIIIGALFILICLCIYQSYKIFSHLETISIDWEIIEKLGQRGDYISGTIGTLLSIAGIFAVLIAYLSQIKQLRLQRHEIELQEGQISMQINLMQAQQNQITSQNEEISRNKINDQIVSFENNFYKLLDLLSFVSTQNNFLDMSNKLNKILKGNIDNFIKDILMPQDGSIKKVEEFKMKTYFKRCYMDFYKSYDKDASEYFRILYNCLKLIEKNKDFLDKNAKLKHKFYSNILRAKISQYELYIIFLML